MENQNTTATETFEITGIQLFPAIDVEYEIEECVYETQKSYCANIIINDEFVAQCSGTSTFNDDGSEKNGECRFDGIPTSDDCFWNNKEKQDWYSDNLDDDDLLEQLEKNDDFENNFEWLRENGKII